MINVDNRTKGEMYMSKWIIDSDHSVASFSIKHMMIANVRGQFNKMKGEIRINE